jgi:hypothetical protein
MTECCKGTGAECREKLGFDVEELKTNAVGLGFDAGWVAEIIEKWGPTVLPLVLEAIRQGFSKQTVVDLLAQFGPKMLDWVVSLFNRRSMMAKSAAPGAWAGGDVLDQSIILTVLDKYLPQLLQQFGPAVIDQLLAYVKSHEAEIMGMVSQAVMNAIGGNTMPSPNP